jgi:hypothetical protein
MTPAAAHVWIAVFAAEFVRKRDAVSAIVAADGALYDLNQQGRRHLILDALDTVLRQGPDIP